MENKGIDVYYRKIVGLDSSQPIQITESMPIVKFSHLTLQVKNPLKSNYGTRMCKLYYIISKQK